MASHQVTLYAEGHVSDDERSQLARSLGGDVGAIEDSGFFDVVVVADDRDAALQHVADGLAETGIEERVTFPSTTGTDFHAPGERAADPDEVPADEPPHLQGGSPHDDVPAPGDDPPRDIP